MHPIWRSARLDFLSHWVRRCFYCLSHHELGFLCQLLGAKCVCLWNGKRHSHLNRSLVTRSCPALCHLVDRGLPGSSDHGISSWGDWSGLPLPSPADLSDSGIEPISPALTGGLVTTEPPAKPLLLIFLTKCGGISVLYGPQMERQQHADRVVVSGQSTRGTRAMQQYQWRRRCSATVAASLEVPTEAADVPDWAHEEWSPVDAVVPSWQWDASCSRNRAEDRRKLRYTVADWVVIWVVYEQHTHVISGILQRITCCNIYTQNA